MKNSYWLELALIIISCLLALQLFGPTVAKWWKSPAPDHIGTAYLDDDFWGTCFSHAYLVRLPASYHQRKDWPLVIYLHGSGRRGINLELLRPFAQNVIMSRDAAKQAVVLAPQCRPDHRWRPNDVGRFLTCVSREYEIDPSRVYLIGASMGGYGTWAAAAHPSMLAAIVPIAGGGDNGTAAALAKVPTWAFHGQQDKVVPPEQSTDLIQAIRDAGGDPKITLYPEGGHGVYYQALQEDELWDWLFQQSLKHR